MGISDPEQRASGPSPVHGAARFPAAALASLVAGALR